MIFVLSKWLSEDRMTPTPAFEIRPEERLQCGRIEIEKFKWRHSLPDRYSTAMDAGQKQKLVCVFAASDDGHLIMRL
jgi:hypothetical protein